MNERIRELAEQAGYTTDMFGVGHWDMPECKKFAELIVRECAEVAANVVAEHEGVDFGLVEKCYEHFGVRE
jgi:hypothetical protein